MQKTSCRVWAEREFEKLDVGDERRRSRTVALATAIAQTPGGRITQVAETSADKEGAFRWVRNGAITSDALMKASARVTAERCGKFSHAFVAVDQSSIAIVDHGTSKGFGPTGRGSIHRKSRGLQAMSAVAISPTGGTVGLLAQAWWARSDERSPSFRSDRRPVEERESGLWSKCIMESLEAFEDTGSSCRLWFQLDRGGDAYHVLTMAGERGFWLTVRSAYDRRLEKKGTHYLRKSLAENERSGFVELKLPKARAKRLGRSHRRPIKLALSHTAVTLRLSHPISKARREQAVFVVRAREYRPPRGAERLEWWLLTTYPVADFRDAQQVLRGYTLRWRVEEFHRTWKSGACHVQSSQLRSRHNFQRWATLLATVAARIERLKFLARNEPDTPASEVLSRDEIDAAILVSKTKKHRPAITSQSPTPSISSPSPGATEAT